MFDQELLDNLYRECMSKNVTMRGDPDNYLLFKYNQNCVIENAWNDINRQARGIIFYAPTARIVCRPFDKFFNLDERQDTKLESLPTSKFITWEKLDGSCCSSFNMWNQIHIATPGSYESPQAEWATKWLREFLTNNMLLESFKEDNKWMTFIFEGIWSESAGNPAPSVLDYGEMQGLVLLTIRYHNGVEVTPDEVDIYANKYCFARPKRFDCKLTRDLSEEIPDNEEGYVIQYVEANNFRVKVKSPTYMMLHRTRDNLSYKNVCKMMEVEGDMEWVKTLPKNLKERFDDIMAQLYQEYYKIYYTVEAKFFESAILKSRKEQAKYILGSDLDRQYTGLVFALLDGKSIESSIWAILKSSKRFQEIDMEA